MTAEVICGHLYNKNLHNTSIAGMNLRTCTWALGTALPAPINSSNSSSAIWKLIARQNVRREPLIDWRIFKYAHNLSAAHIPCTFCPEIFDRVIFEGYNFEESKVLRGFYDLFKHPQRLSRNKHYF